MQARWFPIGAWLVLLGGCSAGPASVEARYDADAGLVHLSFETEGKNTFRVGTRSCEAPKGGTCEVTVPVIELTGGWNTLTAETKRRTGMESPLATEVHLGAEAFPRDCRVTEISTPRREDAAIELRCTFPDGYSGELWGEALAAGRRRIPVGKLVSETEFGDGAARTPTPDDPLLVVDLPVEVVNSAGGRMARPMRVALPAPFVQFRVRGYEAEWFDRAMPLRLKAEEGAVVTIDGKRIRPEREGREFVVERRVDAGENTITLRAEKEGRVPTEHVLRFVGRYPESPLHIDSPTETEFKTDEQSLRIRGRTHPDAEVFWGRIPVFVQPDGAFVIDAYLEEGRNDVEVSAFLAETEFGRLSRKPSTRTFVVDREPARTSRRATPSQAETLEPLGIAEVADHPWQTAGENVKFAMRADTVSLFPSERTCRATIEGVACGLEETRTAYIGFRDVRARTCVGREFPTFVDLDFCPKFDDGAWVEIEGLVVGGFAGRDADQTTIVSLRVDGKRAELRPRLVAETR